MDRKDVEYAAGRRFLVYGASGEIGKAIAARLQEAGGVVIAGGRDGGKLGDVAKELGLKGEPFVAGLGSLAEIEAERNRLFRAGGGIDTLIVAAGHDVREPFHLHGEAEIAATVDVNLKGLAYLIRAFLPGLRVKRGASVAVVGGFGDGRLSFAYHALDAATRAGAYTLLEGLRRENRAAGLRTLYFCPPAVRTGAEAPWLPLWEGLGVKIVEPAEAARSFLRALRKGKPWWMMGNALDRFGARLNAARPALADRLFMEGMSGKIMDYVDKGGML